MMMSDESVDTTPAADEEDGRGPIELIAAILLGLAALLTAYAAYYGALAGGDALKGYSQSQRSLADANGWYNDGTSAENQDQSVFLEYQVRIEENGLDDPTADYIRKSLFSARLETAYQAWDPAATVSPFETDVYVVEEYQEGDAAYARADKEFVEAQKTDDQGDNMDLAAVFLAVSLFFAGIASLFKVNKISYTLLIGSAILLVPGIWAITKGRGW